RVNDFTTNTWNRFTQGIDKAKTSISQITWAGFVQKMDNAKTSVKNFGSNTWTGFTARIDAIKNSASNALIPVKALFDENQVVRQTARREIAATLKPIFTEPATNTWNKFTQSIDSA
ncbi:MAG: hypothetical protein ACKO96_38715, partial [Flammeovirgaceae bacterium]